ncbi:MAG TPA: 3-isopropylmalate dehydratase small subunit [Myxococcota bacterium]|nr:3-isopropylmalate dehydratase small subunit [Myxococcota bacterium]
MSAPNLRVIESRYVTLPLDNIDTDQIIPARFLKVVSREGIGRGLFADWRYDASGTPKPDFVLNTPAASDARILVAGDNFGCGSSREHAPWALVDFGFRAVIATSVADIFRSNALKNGLLPIAASPAFVEKLLRGDAGSVRIDLEACEVTLADGSREVFSVDAFARYRLLNGIDELDFLLRHDPQIRAFEDAHP